jgi:signal peptidase I
MNRGPSARRAWIGEVWDWVRHLGYAGLFFYFLTAFGFQSFQIEGVSMLPLLHDGERIFVNRYIYRFRLVQRGDVVVFWYPPDPSKTLVKRVLGIPGDMISIREGRLFLNRGALEEPYVPEALRDTYNLPTVTVPSGYYFVLGDDRKNSDDSRRWGLVPQRYILGRVVLRFWPLDRFGLIEHPLIESPPPAAPEPTVDSAAPQPDPPIPTATPVHGRH